MHEDSYLDTYTEDFLSGDVMGIQDASEALGQELDLPNDDDADWENFEERPDDDCY